MEKELIESKINEYNKENALKVTCDVVNILKDATDSDYEYIWQYAATLEDEYKKIIFWGCVLESAATSQRLLEFIKLLRTTKSLQLTEKYYLRWQATAITFNNNALKSEEYTNEDYLLYKDLYDAFKNNFHLEKIYNRNPKLVLVTVQQFLDTTHGPTKTTLDRASVLKRLGYDVIIINTAELFGGKKVGYFHTLYGKYLPELSTKEFVEYQGVKYPFFQMDKNMPNVDSVRILVDFVHNNKPEFIVNIGGDSLTVDILANIVPVLNINTVPSSISTTMATCQATGNADTASYMKYLNLLDKTIDNVIVGRFTSSLKEQVNHFSKELLGLPMDRLLLAVIGGRLTDEIQEDFINMLESVLENGATVFIVGKMLNYDDVCKKHPIFARYSINLGMQSDVLAILDCLDVYVNPKRTGGGTSVIEAMSKGLPAVTVDMGDVALGAGPDFCVKDYDEMQATLLRYIKDKDYYKEMSHKAKKRAEYMLDSFSAFSKIIDEFKKRIEKLF